MDLESSLFLFKAAESLASAEADFAARRYNSCANRAYYAAFQGAVCALSRAGIGPPQGEWGHSFVQAEFVGQLINRRKTYPADLRATLLDNLVLRHRADYDTQQVTEAQAFRALHRTRGFLDAIRRKGVRTP